MTVTESGARGLVLGKERETNRPHPLVIDKGAVACPTSRPPIQRGASNPIPTPTPSTRPHMFSRRSSRAKDTLSPKTFMPAGWFDRRPRLPQYFSRSGYILVRFADQMVAYFCASLKPSNSPRTSVYWPGAEGHLIAIHGLSPVGQSRQRNRPGSREFPHRRRLLTTPRPGTQASARGYVTISRLFRRHQSPKPSPRAAPTTRPPFAKFANGCRVRQAATPAKPPPEGRGPRSGVSSLASIPLPQTNALQVVRLLIIFSLHRFCATVYVLEPHGIKSRRWEQDGANVCH